MDKNVKEIRRRWTETTFLKNDTIITIDADIVYLLSQLEEKEKRIKKLEEGIEEIIDSGNKMMSFSIENRLKELVEKKGG